MSQSELLKTVVHFLEASNIPYMVTGSFASSLQGAPRSTHDIDIVVQLRWGDAPRITETFSEPDYYVEHATIIDAIKHESTFNILDNRHGDKIDFWLLQDSAFDASRFSRRQAQLFEGMQVLMSTPEDTILMKLKWSKDSGGSEKQMNDVRNVYKLQHAFLDPAYLKKWAIKLGVTELLDQTILSIERKT